MAPRSQQWRASVDASRSRSGGRRCATRCVLRPYRQYRLYPRRPYRRPQPVLVAPRATAGWLPEDDSSRPSAWSGVARCGVAAAPTDEDVAAATVQKAQEASRRPRPPRRSPSASSRPTQPRVVERGRRARASDATCASRANAKCEPSPACAMRHQSLHSTSARAPLHPCLTPLRAVTFRRGRKRRCTCGKRTRQ